MKILITGGKGYIATSLRNSLETEFQVVTVSRSDFNLSVSTDTEQWFSGKYFDVVIHTAIKGGSRLSLDTSDVLDTNLKMYYNLLDNRSHFGKLISFGSGAEIYKRDTFYGLSKHVIRQSILNIDNFYNIRIFGVFDENELETRFIKSNILRYLRKEPIIVHQNKFMDFFYMKDLVSLIKYYIENQNLPKEVDCTYNKSYSLLDIANMINRLSTHAVDINIGEKFTFDEKYYGTPNTLLNYIGLEMGIIDTYNKLSQ